MWTELSAPRALKSDSAEDHRDIGEFELRPASEIRVGVGQLEHLVFEFGLPLRRGRQEVGTALQQRDQARRGVSRRVAEDGPVNTAESIAKGDPRGAAGVGPGAVRTPVAFDDPGVLATHACASSRSFQMAAKTPP